MRQPSREPREVKLTRAAFDDLRWQKITRGELNALLEGLERVARCECVQDDYAVCTVKQCDDRWSRLKITNPSQIRAFFTVEKNDTLIVVRCILRRAENTYDQAELIFKYQTKAA